MRLILTRRSFQMITLGMSCTSHESTFDTEIQKRSSLVSQLCLMFDVNLPRCQSSRLWLIILTLFEHLATNVNSLFCRIHVNSENIFLFISWCYLVCLKVNLQEFIEINFCTVNLCSNLPVVHFLVMLVRSNFFLSSIALIILGKQASYKDFFVTNMWRILVLPLVSVFAPYFYFEC